MNIATLWYCDPSESLLNHIVNASRHHADKYGNKPNCCHVHPGLLDGEIVVPGIQIVVDGQIQKNHIWIGVDQSELG